MKFMGAREILDGESGFSKTSILDSLGAQCNLSTLQLLLNLT
jgi:hypothetical protein